MHNEHFVVDSSSSGGETVYWIKTDTIAPNNFVKYTHDIEDRLIRIEVLHDSIELLLNFGFDSFVSDFKFKLPNDSSINTYYFDGIGRIYAYSSYVDDELKKSYFIERDENYIVKSISSRVGGDNNYHLVEANDTLSYTRYLPSIVGYPFMDKFVFQFSRQKYTSYYDLDTNRVEILYEWDGRIKEKIISKHEVKIVRSTFSEDGVETREYFKNNLVIITRRYKNGFEIIE